MPWRYNAVDVQVEFVATFIYIPQAEINFESGDLEIDLGTHDIEGDIDQGERVIDGNF